MLSASPQRFSSGTGPRGAREEPRRGGMCWQSSVPAATAPPAPGMLRQRRERHCGNGHGAAPRARRSLRSSFPAPAHSGCSQRSWRCQMRPQPREERAFSWGSQQSCGFRCSPGAGGGCQTLAWNNPGSRAGNIHPGSHPVLIGTLSWLIKAKSSASHCSLARGQFQQELSGQRGWASWASSQACGGFQVLLHLPQDQGFSSPSCWAGWKHLETPCSAPSVPALACPSLIPRDGTRLQPPPPASRFSSGLDWGWKLSALTSAAPQAGR